MVPPGMVTGHPANMERVRWTGDSLLPRLMEGMQFTRRDADIQPTGQPVLMGCLATVQEMESVHRKLNCHTDYLYICFGSPTRPP